MRKERPGFMLYDNAAKIFVNLPDAQAGMLIKAICSYKLEGSTQCVNDPILAAVFEGIRNDMDIDAQKYREKCEKNSENARKRSKANGNER